MSAKVISIKKKRNGQELSLEQCKKFLNKDQKQYTDDEVIAIRDYMTILVRIYYDFYQRTFKQQLRIVHLNKNNNDTQESNTLCEGEHRRAS